MRTNEQIQEDARRDFIRNHRLASLATFCIDLRGHKVGDNRQCLYCGLTSMEIAAYHSYTLAHRSWPYYPEHCYTSYPEVRES